MARSSAWLAKYTGRGADGTRALLYGRGRVWCGISGWDPYASTRRRRITRCKRGTRKYTAARRVRQQGAPYRVGLSCTPLATS